LTEKRIQSPWERAVVQKIVTPLLLASVLAACAPTVPAVVPAPAALQAAPVQAVAPAAKQTAAVVSVAKTPAVAAPKATQPAVTVAAKPAAQPVSTTAATAKTATDWADVDLSAAFASLTGAAPTGPDEVDDDSDLQTGFNTKFWFGWWGLDGLDRALRAFSNEEGRMISWRPLPSGWVGMTAQMSTSELINAIAIAINPLYSRTPTSYWNLPSSFRKHTTRHLKLYRRQGVLGLQSKQLAYYQVSMMFMGGNYGYIARAENGPERYVAYYDAGGSLLATFGTKTATGGGVPDVGILSTP
jgi:hypothetical protein